ncbi:hypothetical protein PILCRDRAFT_762509 [Piloderma croceum F 1598]|uniref:Protein kinase domain-containing protein n=1 Tax=Piloderma croceum (strain F 1598) TaxID=765440 RepID=A0A0C3C0S7_PILCF|nr:hypothetical protein PILCRDRAFT_762509 [Piloderma croceum F 1598]
MDLPTHEYRIRSQYGTKLDGLIPLVDKQYVLQRRNSLDFGCLDLWDLTGIHCFDCSHQARTIEPQFDTPLSPVKQPQLRVHKNLVCVLNDLISTATCHETSLSNTLQRHIENMTAHDTISSLVNSYRFRTELMAVASALSSQDDLRIRRALDKDDADIDRLMSDIICSDIDTKAVMQLKGVDAEQFLTVTYSILDKEVGSSEGINKLSRNRAHRLIVRLSENAGILPPSLSITGVRDCSKEVISGGGFADIFRTVYQGKPVALKCLRDFQVHQERDKVSRKFCREALLWKSVQHLNVLPFYGVDFETFLPRICMVSPWMQHGTLLKHIERLGGPRNANIDKYVCHYLYEELLETAEGLYYLHSRNIIHGDLRGNNIFIDDDWHVRIADFGLAGWADSTLATSSTSIFGSIRWMAPELYTSGMSRRTTASDVYAFGCLCLESYTGAPPFKDIRDGAVILKVIQGERPQRPTPEMSRPMSDELWDLVNLCWKHNPDGRPKMNDVKYALKDGRHAFPTIGSPSSLGVSSKSMHNKYHSGSDMKEVPRSIPTRGASALSAGRRSPLSSSLPHQSDFSSVRDSISEKHTAPYESSFHPQYPSNFHQSFSASSSPSFQPSSLPSFGSHGLATSSSSSNSSADKRSFQRHVQKTSFDHTIEREGIFSGVSSRHQVDGKPLSLDSLAGTKHWADALFDLGSIGSLGQADHSNSNTQGNSLSEQQFQNLSRSPYSNPTYPLPPGNMKGGLSAAAAAASAVMAQGYAQLDAANLAGTEDSGLDYRQFMGLAYPNMDNGSYLAHNPYTHVNPTHILPVEQGDGAFHASPLSDGWNNNIHSSSTTSPEPYNISTTWSPSSVEGTMSNRNQPRKLLSSERVDSQKKSFSNPNNSPSPQCTEVSQQYA